MTESVPEHGEKKSVGLSLGLKCSSLGFKIGNPLGKTDIEISVLRLAEQKCFSEGAKM